MSGVTEITNKTSYDVEHIIHPSVNHIVKFKAGSAFYFLSSIYINANGGFLGISNKIYVGIKKVRKTSSDDSNIYYIELNREYSSRFEQVNIFSLPKNELNTICTHNYVELYPQITKNYEGNIIYNELYESKNKFETFSQIDAYITEQRTKTLIPDVLLNSYIGNSFVPFDGINDSSSTGQYIVMDGTTNLMPIADKSNDIIILRKNKKNFNLVSVKEEKTIILK